MQLLKELNSTYKIIFLVHDSFYMIGVNILLKEI